MERKERIEDIIKYVKLCKSLKETIDRNHSKLNILNRWKAKHPCFGCKYKRICKAQ